MATMSSDYHTGNTAHDDDVWRPDGGLQTDTTNSNRTNAANRSSGRRSGSRSNGHHSGYSVRLSNLSGSNGNKSGSNGHKSGSNGHKSGSNGFHKTEPFRPPKSSRSSNGFIRSGGGGGPTHTTQITHGGAPLLGDSRSSPQVYTDITSKQTTGGESANKKTTNEDAAAADAGSPDQGHASEEEDEDEDDHTETFVMRTGVAFAAPGSSPEPPVEPNMLEATPAPHPIPAAPMDDETNKRDPREGTPAPPNPPRAASSEEAFASGKDEKGRKETEGDYNAPPPAYRLRRVPALKPRTYQERTVAGQPVAGQPSSGMHKARAQQLNQQQLLQELQQVPVGHHMPAHARAAAASASAAQQLAHQAAAHAQPAYVHAAAPATTTNVYPNPMPKPHWPPQPPPQQANPFAQVVNQARKSFGADHGVQHQAHAPQVHAPQVHAPPAHATPAHATQVHAAQAHATQVHATQAHAPQAPQQLPAPQHHLPQQHGSTINYQQWLKKYSQHQQQQHWEYAPAQGAHHHHAQGQQQFAPTTAEAFQNPRAWHDPNTGAIYAATQASVQAPQVPPRADYYYGGHQYYWTPAPQVVHAQQDWMLYQPHTHLGHQNVAQTKPQAPPATATQAHQPQPHQPVLQAAVAPPAPQHHQHHHQHHHHQPAVVAQTAAGAGYATAATHAGNGGSLQQGWRMLTNGQIVSVNAAAAAPAAPVATARQTVPQPTAAYPPQLQQLQPATAPAAAHYPQPALQPQYAQPGNGPTQAVHYPQPAVIHGNGSPPAAYYQPTVPAEWRRFPTAEPPSISPASENDNGLRGAVHQPAQAAASYAAVVGNGNGGNGPHHAPAALLGAAAASRPARRRLRPRQRASRYIYPRQRGSKVGPAKDESGTTWNYRRRKRSRNNIYIKNMHLETTKQDVVQFFRRYGPIGSVRMLTDQITNLFLGRCMIQFVHDASATKCVNAMKRKLDRVQAYFGDRVYADFAFEQNPNRANGGSAWANAHTKEVAPVKILTRIPPHVAPTIPYVGPPHADQQVAIAQHENKKARDDIIAQLIDGPALAGGDVDGDVDANVPAPPPGAPPPRAHGTPPSDSDSGYSTEREPPRQRTAPPPVARLPEPTPDPHPLGTYRQTDIRARPQLVIGPLAHIFTQNPPGAVVRMTHSQAYAQAAPPMAATMQQLPVGAAPPVVPAAAAQPAPMYKNGNGGHSGHARAGVNGNGGLHPGNGNGGRKVGGDHGDPRGGSGKRKRKKRGKRHGHRQPPNPSG